MRHAQDLRPRADLLRNDELLVMLAPKPELSRQREHAYPLDTEAFCGCRWGVAITASPRVPLHKSLIPTAARWPSSTTIQTDADKTRSGTGFRRRRLVNQLCI